MPLCAMPFGGYVGVYPFFGLVWVAFLLANVVDGARALHDNIWPPLSVMRILWI